MKNINLGYIQISDYISKSRLFGDWMYEDEEYSKEISECRPEEEILPKNTEFTLKIDYPLSIPFVKKFNTKDNLITRRQLVNFIVRCYKQIYKEENYTSTIKEGYIEGMFNRVETNGKYGIKYHVIGDLILHAAHIDKNNIITLGVDS